MVLFGLAFAGGASSAWAIPPTIVSSGVSAATTNSVVLEAEINPQNRATTYRFEYGAADCASNPCTVVPLKEGEEGKIPSGSSPVAVSASVQGLDPGTTYHFRVVAKSSGAGGGQTPGPDRVFATYLEPQVFGPCSNDALRTENPAAARIERSSADLPDCRAYERASPLDKNAGDVTGTVPLARAALSGGKISFVSTTGVPGGLGSQEFPTYLASRGSGAWSTQGLLPPASEGQNALVLGWTPDFEEVFAKATQIDKPPKTELLMTPAGGTPIQIADYAPEPNMFPSFAGATDGAGEVLFESRAALPGVQGAIEGKPNLYLWDRASGQLFLAGVENDSEAPPQGAFAGSYDWIAGENPTGLHRGGADASYYTQEQHALSDDGNAVYFTAAGTGQLYVRVNPTAAQSALNGEGECTQPELACTIRISAPQKTNGPGGGPDPGGPRSAAFMAASSDGSRALFTSPEKLTDDANTGPEQESAAIELADVSDGASVNPNCIPTHALGLAVDATHIYWADPGAHAIGRAELDCGSPEEFIDTGANVPQYVAVNGEYVYWTAKPAEEVADQFPVQEGGTIGRALKSDGGEVEPEFITGLSAPQGIAVDAGHIYWGNAREAHNALARADIDGENVELRFSEIGNGEVPRGVAVDATHIYWTPESLGISGFSFVCRRELDGGTAGEICIGSGEKSAPRGLAVDSGHLYWARKDGDTIARANLNLEERELEWIKEADRPFGIAVSAEHVFWSSNGEANPNPGNDLYRYEGGVLSDLSLDSTSEDGTDVQGVLGASEDATYVYYAANGVPDGLTGSPNAQGETATPGDCKGLVGSASGTCNLYLWHEDPVTHAQSTTFIARLRTDGNEIQSDAVDWAAKTAELFLGNINAEKTSRVTPDGLTLLFRSQRQLSDYDNEGVPQFYRYRVGDPGPTCVSCNPTGLAPTGRGPDFGRVFTAVVAPTNPASLLSRNLSSDGSRVFFETTDALVSEDTNGDVSCGPTGSALQNYPSCLDVYEWEAQGAPSCDAQHAVPQGGCLYLLSTGKGKEPALIADASGDGKDLFFYTRARLVGEDEDQLLDVYDARVEGGLAGQNQPSPTSCEGEACRPAPSSSSSIEAPPQFSGPGNPKAKPQACKRGTHRVKGRCVPRKKHHKRRRHKGTR